MVSILDKITIILSFRIPRWAVMQLPTVWSITFKVNRSFMPSQSSVRSWHQELRSKKCRKRPWKTKKSSRRSFFYTLVITLASGFLHANYICNSQKELVSSWYYSCVGTRPKTTPMGAEKPFLLFLDLQKKNGKFPFNVFILTQWMITWPLSC